MAKHGEFSHIEFPAEDLERAKSFYSKVFGWQFEQMDGFDDYWLYTAGPGDLGGGFGLRGTTAPGQVRNYMRVDSVDASLEAVEANGGIVVTPKTDIGIGWYAAVKDTEGNEIALWQRKAEA